MEILYLIVLLWRAQILYSAEHNLTEEWISGLYEDYKVIIGVEFKCELNSKHQHTHTGID